MFSRAAERLHARTWHRLVAQLLALVLTTEVEHRRRIKYTLVGAFLHAVCASLVVFAVWVGITRAFESYLLVAAMLVSNVFFYVALRSGWSLRFQDPSLALAQILTALTYCVYAYMHAQSAHGGMLMPVCLVLVYGVFHVSQRLALIAATYASLLLGAAMLYKALTDPLLYPPMTQLAFFLMALTIIPTIAAVASNLANLRARIARQQAALANAMHRFQLNGEVPDWEQAEVGKAQDALYRQFAVLTRERQELDAQRDLMLASISHDLRSPLGRIRMAAELLPKAKGVAKRREAIVRNVNVTNRLLGDFIEWARSGQETISGEVDLRALVLNTVSVMPHVRVVELPEQAQWLEPANAHALERVLNNLVDNALAYGKPPIEIGLRCGATTSLWVRDHGVGINAMDAEHFLKTFTRGETNRLRPGTGLGLAIVNRTITRHGGRVALLNAEPGLNVLLHLPACKQMCD